MYGQSLHLDLHDCDATLFTRETVDKFFTELCNLIDMEKCERFWWDDVDVPDEERQTSPHTQGTSAVQFILTSSITVSSPTPIVIHTLDQLRSAYVDIFSCKNFDAQIAEQFVAEFFRGRIVQSEGLMRE